MKWQMAIALETGLREFNVVFAVRLPNALQWLRVRLDLRVKEILTNPLIPVGPPFPPLHFCSAMSLSHQDLHRSGSLIPMLGRRGTETGLHLPGYRCKCYGFLIPPRDKQTVKPFSREPAPLQGLTR